MGKEVSKEHTKVGGLGGYHVEKIIYSNDTCERKKKAIKIQFEKKKFGGTERRVLKKGLKGRRFRSGSKRAV